MPLPGRTHDRNGSLNRSTSVDTPEMCELKASRHVSRDTVHGGNHFPKLAAFTVHVTNAGDAHSPMAYLSIEYTRKQDSATVEQAQDGS